MNILIVRSFPNFVDLNKKTYNSQELGLATAFCKLGHNVTIILYSKKPIDNFEYKTIYGNISIVYLQAKIKLFKYFMVFKNFDNIAKKFDMIISNEYSQIDTFHLVSKYPEKTIIYHGPYFSRTSKKYNLYTKFYDLVFLNKLKKINPKIVVKSKNASEYLINKGLNVSSIVGVGLDINNFKDKVVNLPDFLENIKGSDYLLYIGRIEARRNIDFLIKTFYKIHLENEKIKIVIIGSGDAKYEKKIMRLIEFYHLKNNVIWYKKVEQKYLPSIYLNSSWFLLPTSYEIWGMVLMEAIYFNVPILTTNNGGSSSLVKNGVNGFIEDFDSDKWKNTIVNCKLDRSNLKKVNGDILNIYNWENIANKFLNVFNSETNLLY